MKALIVLFALIGCASASYNAEQCLDELQGKLDALDVPSSIDEYIRRIKTENPSESLYKMSWEKLEEYPPVPECETFGSSVREILYETSACQDDQGQDALSVVDQLIISGRYDIIIGATRACSQ